MNDPYHEHEDRELLKEHAAHPERFRAVKTENPKEEAGRKKCPLQLLPPAAMRETANALGHGAEKYSQWNFRGAGINATTYIGACYRHLSAWADGEDLDPESGLSHIAHISACCAILLDCMHTRMMNDDRSKVPTPEEAAERMGRSVLCEVTPGKPVPCAPSYDAAKHQSAYL